MGTGYHICLFYSMRKHILFLSFTVLSVGFLSAQNKFNLSDLPAAVKQAFARQYPGILPQWDKEDGRYEAEFKKNGKEMSAVFDETGTLMESESEISLNELPHAVMGYMRAHYNNMAIRESTKITLASGKVEYEVAIKGMDILFDANGNFEKELKR
jgi:hypothetical protein